VQWFSFNLLDFSVSFLSILFEGAPFMFIGTLIAGFVDAFVPAHVMERMLPRNISLAVGLSAVLGVAFPMCECGLVPVIRRMIGKGMPVSCALTYLLSAPIVNPIVAISTIAAFRGQRPIMTASLRLTIGFLVACIVGLIVARLSPKLILNREMQALLPNPDTNPMRELNSDSPNSIRTHFSPFDGFKRKALGAIQCGGHDFLDVAFYLVVGAAIASIFNTAINRELLIPLSSHTIFATIAMMGLAFLLSLCSTSDAFIAANFSAFPLVAKLAFMVFGPMMDGKLFLMYALVFRKRFTLLLTLGLLGLIALICVALGALKL
jgi:uncharacterized membrane protein YraQ (UPF0718 family)